MLSVGASVATSSLLNSHFLVDYIKMGFLKALSLLVVLIGSTQATGYGAGAGGVGVGGGFRPSVGSYSGGGGRGGGGGGNYPPQPYDFDYQARDEQGNVHYRQEQGDSSGAVRGSYGYTDNQGLYRVVEYVADANGFRANVRTNEPGTGKDAPADVNWVAEVPPAGIQDRYTRGGAGAYRGGAGAGSYSSGVVAGAGGFGGAGFRAGGVGGGHRSGKGGY